MYNKKQKELLSNFTVNELSMEMPNGDTVEDLIGERLEELDK